MMRQQEEIMRGWQIKILILILFFFAGCAPDHKRSGEPMLPPVTEIGDTLYLYNLNTKKVDTFLRGDGGAFYIPMGSYRAIQKKDTAR